MLGNALEWYDFVVFGFMTVIIARLFFPGDSAYSALLFTTATFGVGFVMRPIGGIVLGVYADRHGRKAAMQLIIFMMSVALLLIAVTPTHATIGIAAPLVMVVARSSTCRLSLGRNSASRSAMLSKCRWWRCCA